MSVSAFQLFSAPSSQFTSGTVKNRPSKTPFPLTSPHPSGYAHFQTLILVTHKTGYGNPNINPGLRDPKKLILPGRVTWATIAELQSLQSTFFVHIL